MTIEQITDEILPQFFDEHKAEARQCTFTYQDLKTALIATLRENNELPLPIIFLYNKSIREARNAQAYADAAQDISSRIEFFETKQP